MRIATMLSLVTVSSLLLSCAANGASGAARSTDAREQAPREAPRNRDWYEAQYGGCSQLAAPAANSTPLTQDQLEALDLLRGSAAPDGSGERKLGVGPPGQGVRGSLSKDQIRTVIRGGMGDVRWCFERALEVWPSAAGRVIVMFLIAPDGTVPRAEVTENKTNITDLGCCIALKVRGWTFPKPDGGGIVIVSYPFTLERAPAP